MQALPFCLGDLRRLQLQRGRRGGLPWPAPRAARWRLNQRLSLRLGSGGALASRRQPTCPVRVAPRQKLRGF